LRPGLNPHRAPARLRSMAWVSGSALRRCVRSRGSCHGLEGSDPLSVFAHWPLPRGRPPDSRAPRGGCHREREFRSPAQQPPAIEALRRSSDCRLQPSRPREANAFEPPRPQSVPSRTHGNRDAAAPTQDPFQSSGCQGPRARMGNFHPGCAPLSASRRVAASSGHSPNRGRLSADGGIQRRRGKLCRRCCRRHQRSLRLHLSL